MSGLPHSRRRSCSGSWRRPRESWRRGKSQRSRSALPPWDMPRSYGAAAWPWGTSAAAAGLNVSAARDSQARRLSCRMDQRRRCGGRRRCTSGASNPGARLRLPALQPQDPRADVRGSRRGWGEHLCRNSQACWRGYYTVRQHRCSNPRRCPPERWRWGKPSSRGKRPGGLPRLAWTPSPAWFVSATSGGAVASMQRPVLLRLLHLPMPALLPPVLHRSLPNGRCRCRPTSHLALGVGVGDFMV